VFGTLATVRAVQPNETGEACGDPHGTNGSGFISSVGKALYLSTRMLLEQNILQRCSRHTMKFITILVLAVCARLICTVAHLQMSPSLDTAGISIDGLVSSTTTESVPLNDSDVFTRRHLSESMESTIDGQPMVFDTEIIVEDETERKALTQTQVFIKMLTGKTVTLQLTLSDSVSSCKAMIHDKEGLPPDMQDLLLSGYQLKDSDTLAESYVIANSTIHLILKIRGGMSAPSDEQARISGVISISAAGAQTAHPKAAYDSALTPQLVAQLDNDRWGAFTYYAAPVEEESLQPLRSSQMSPRESMSPPPLTPPKTSARPRLTSNNGSITSDGVGDDAESIPTLQPPKTTLFSPLPPLRSPSLRQLGPPPPRPSQPLLGEPPTHLHINYHVLFGDNHSILFSPCFGTAQSNARPKRSRRE